MGDQEIEGPRGDEDEAPAFKPAPAGDFALSDAAPAPAAKPRRARAAKERAAVELATYVHPERRANNPEVGIVHAEGDPDAPAASYAYDPHIDPALRFDVKRSAVEALIDAALASGEEATMRAQLERVDGRRRAGRAHTRSHGGEGKRITCRRIPSPYFLSIIHYR